MLILVYVLYPPPPPPMTNSSPTVNLHSGLEWELTPNPPIPLALARRIRASY